MSSVPQELHAEKSMYEKIKEAINNVEEQQFIGGVLTPHALEMVVRAVLLALKEPTKEMLENLESKGIMWKHNNSTDVYKAMIEGIKVK